MKVKNNFLFGCLTHVVFYIVTGTLYSYLQNFVTIGFKMKKWSKKLSQDLKQTNIKLFNK